MNKVQWIAFRIIIQFLYVICGQVLGMADREFGVNMYWKTANHLDKFYEAYDVEE